MKVSVVVPVYNEEGNLPELLTRLVAVMDGIGEPYEVVFVDDGSRDGSLAILKQAAAARPDRIRVLELARNFGQHQAILAAFESVTGDAVVTLDADLQNPPEEIPKLLAKMKEGLRRRRRRAPEPPGHVLAPARVRQSSIASRSRSRGCT